MADTSYECVLPVLPARRRTKIDGIRRGTKREREREREAHVSARPVEKGLR